MNFWEYLRKVFSESDGTPSFARCGTGVLVIASIAFNGFLVVKNQKMPDLAGQAPYLVCLYGVNKISAVIGKFSKT